MADPVIEKVEEFIRRIHDGIYKIDPAANNIMFSEPDKGINKSLSAHLAEEMHGYDVLKTFSPSSNQRSAASCLMWIDRAFTYGVHKKIDVF